MSRVDLNISWPIARVRARGLRRLMSVGGQRSFAAAHGSRGEKLLREAVGCDIQLLFTS